ncbi:MAG: hypothetical protein JNL29_17105 [Nitrospira sp.]|nr:hypothetical protein [Nitrospira sp.]
MISVKSPFAQQTLVAMILFAVIGALSTTWPAIIALMLSVFLLGYSLGIEQEILFLSSAEISHASIILTSLRRPGLPAILE